jgi:hypothetical protein
VVGWHRESLRETAEGDEGHDDAEDDSVVPVSSASYARFPPHTKAAGEEAFETSIGTDRPTVHGGFTAFASMDIQHQ